MTFPAPHPSHMVEKELKFFPEPGYHFPGQDMSQRDKFLWLAERIEEEDIAQFNLSYWFSHITRHGEVNPADTFVNPSKHLNKCGSAGCLAGMIAFHIVPPGVRIRTHSDTPAIARNWLELDDHGAMSLFSSIRFWNVSDLNDVTAQHAVNVIRWLADLDDPDEVLSGGSPHPINLMPGWEE